MPITIAGSGTITGLSAGGLPAGSITAASLATGVGTGKIKNVWSFTDSSETSTSSGDYATIMSTTNIMPSSGTKNLVMVTCPYQIKGAGNYLEGYGAMCLFRDSTKLEAELVGISDHADTSIKRDLGVWSCTILDTHGANGSTNIQYHIKGHSCHSNWTIYAPNDEYYGDFDSSEDLAVARITVMELDL